MLKFAVPLTPFFEFSGAPRVSALHFIPAIFTFKFFKNRFFFDLVKHNTGKGQAAEALPTKVVEITIPEGGYDHRGYLQQ